MKLGATILHGDVMEKLATLPDESVHCVVTSPPYWNLRDYKDNGGSVKGQIGLEPTLGEYIEKMVAVFEEVRRVLRKDGTLWMNMGDCYAGGGNGGGGSFAEDGAGMVAEKGTDKNVPGRKGNRGVTHSKSKRIARGAFPPPQRPPSSPELKRKDLAGVPWRLALAMQEAGWYLRCDVIWNKPNPMPESVYDRPTRAHEYVFLFSKSEKYFYDHEAVKELVSGNAHPRVGIENGELRVVNGSSPTPKGWNTANGRHDTKEGNYSCGGKPSRTERTNGRKMKQLPGGEWVGELFPGVPLTLPSPTEGEGIARAKSVSKSSRFVTDRIPAKERRADQGVKANRSFSAAVVGLVAKRSKRSVWTIPTESFKGEHFATFPRKLVEPCIMAGSSAGGCCSVCGTPRRRIVEDGLANLEWQKACGGDANGKYDGKAQKDFAGAKAQDASATKARILAGLVEKKTVGWKWGCECGMQNAERGLNKKGAKGAKKKSQNLLTDLPGRGIPTIERRVAPCVVMDPFNGSGTTGEVSLVNGRSYIGIDISAKYVGLTNQRLGKVQLPLLLMEEAKTEVMS